MHQDQIHAIAENALNAAALCIQNELDVKTGDIAGIFFAGKNEDIILSILKSYIYTEINYGASL